MKSGEVDIDFMIHRDAGKPCFLPPERHQSIHKPNLDDFAENWKPEPPLTVVLRSDVQEGSVL